MARFMQEQKVDFQAWKQFLTAQAEEEHAAADPENFIADLDGTMCSECGLHYTEDEAVPDSDGLPGCPECN